MFVAHTRLHGLDEDRVLAVVVPVLRAHGVEGVELVWRTGRNGWLLQLTVERPDTRIPGEGVTIDRCSEISRDLSAALDVADVISARYSLEVGSPGLERALYSSRDYERFAGQGAKLKLKQVQDGERVIRGNLQGLDENGHVLLETERGLLTVNVEDIESAHLVFDWNAGRSRKPQKPPRHPSARGNRPRGKNA